MSGALPNQSSAAAGQIGGKNGRITPYTCMANSDKYRFDELRSEQWMATDAGSGVASHGY